MTPELLIELPEEHPQQHQEAGNVAQVLQFSQNEEGPDDDPMFSKTLDDEFARRYGWEDYSIDYSSWTLLREAGVNEGVADELARVWEPSQVR